MLPVGDDTRKGGAAAPSAWLPRPWLSAWLSCECCCCCWCDRSGGADGVGMRPEAGLRGGLRARVPRRAEASCWSGSDAMVCERLRWVNVGGAHRGTWAMVRWFSTQAETH